jgi:hypothetical protein
LLYWCGGTLLLLLYISSSLLSLHHFFRFLILYTVGRTPWTDISPSQSLYLHIGQHIQNKHNQTSTPRVEFELTFLVFEQAKTVHVRWVSEATAIGGIEAMLESYIREVLDGNFGHGIGYPEISVVLLGVPLKREVSTSIGPWILPSKSFAIHHWTNILPSTLCSLIAERSVS